MKNLMQWSMVAVAALALTACGGGAKLDKNGAAQAAFQSGKTSQGAWMQLYEQRAANVGISVTVQGSHGGSASVTLNSSTTTNGTTNLAYSIAYSNFNDGHNTYNGTMNFTESYTGTAGSGSLQFAFQGKVTISGEIDDFVDANVTESLTFSDLTATSGNVSLTVNGTITTSTQTFTYSNENLSISASGSISHT